MKFSGFDFLLDLETRLLVSLAGFPQSSAPEFQRVLNIFEKTLVLKIGWLNLPLGTLACRMVEEPQDFYFRGSFEPTTSGEHHHFTLRPGQDYEKDMTRLVEAIAGTARNAGEPQVQNIQVSDVEAIAGTARTAGKPAPPRKTKRSHDG